MPEPGDRVEARPWEERVVGEVPRSRSPRAFGFGWPALVAVLVLLLIFGLIPMWELVSLRTGQGGSDSQQASVLAVHTERGARRRTSTGRTQRTRYLDVQLRDGRTVQALISDFHTTASAGDRVTVYRARGEWRTTAVGTVGDWLLRSLVLAGLLGLVGAWFAGRRRIRTRGL